MDEAVGLRRTRGWIALLVTAGRTALAAASAQDLVLGAAIAETGVAASWGTMEVDALKKALPKSRIDLVGTESFAPAVLDFVKAYRGAYGSVPGSFAGHAWDAARILEAAIRQALASTSPNDVEAFRGALRDAIEGLHDVPAVDGAFTFSSKDHGGLGSSSAVMVTVRDGAYQLVR